MSRFTRLIILPTLVLCMGMLVFHPAVTHGDEPQTGSSSAIEGLDEGESGVVQRMASRLEVPASELIAWRERGLGWGDIEMTMVLSSRSGKSPDRIFEMWQANARHWQPVGDELGVDDVEALMAESRGDD